MHSEYAEDIRRIDPKEGYLVEYFSDQFCEISDRAREILKNRSREEIFHAATLLDQIVCNSQERAWDVLEEVAEDGIDLPPTNPAQELAYFLNDRPLESVENLDDFKVEELYAVLALAVIGSSYEEQKYQESQGATATGSHIWLNLGYYAIQAMEAVAYAEMKLMQRLTKDEVGSLLRKKQREKSQQAAQQKNKPVNDLLKKLVALYQKGGFKTYSAAVEEFIRVVPEQELRVLAPTNMRRTLREGLSGVVRGKRVLD